MSELDRLLNWCDDMHQVKGNVSQLQATLNQILAKAPTVSEYKDLIRTYVDSTSTTTTSSSSLHLQEKLKISLNSPQLKVAIRLKNLFDKGRLPFLLGMSRINFKSPKSDRFVGYLLDYCPPKQDDIPNITVEDADQIKSGKSGDEYLYPPLLPPIEDDQLMHLVFTDKSLRHPLEYLKLRKSNGSVTFNNSHNRKLVLKGKYTLDSILIDILDDQLPDADENDIEYIRYHLTSSSILAKIAYVYNFPEALVHQISEEASVASKLAIFKNIFLAYIGALTRESYTETQISNWIKALFDPIIKCFVSEAALAGHLKAKEALVWAEFRFLMGRLNNYFLHSIKKIAYDFITVEEDPYVCQLKVDNLLLATGGGVTLMDAKKQAVFQTMTTTPFSELLLNYVAEHMGLELNKRKNKDSVSRKATSSETGSQGDKIPQDLGNESELKQSMVDSESQPDQPDSDDYKPEDYYSEDPKSEESKSEEKSKSEESKSEISNSKDKSTPSNESKSAFNPPLGPRVPQIDLTKMPLAPSNQPRMPLQYGFIPSSLPRNSKKRK